MFNDSPERGIRCSQLTHQKLGTVVGSILENYYIPRPFILFVEKKKKSFKRLLRVNNLCGHSWEGYVPVSFVYPQFFFLFLRFLTQENIMEGGILNDLFSEIIIIQQIQSPGFVEPYLVAVSELNVLNF